MDGKLPFARPKPGEDENGKLAHYEPIITIDPCDPHLLVTVYTNVISNEGREVKDSADPLAPGPRKC